jgi:eukaryotic-like serine/threonine-protein kinase
VTRWISASGCLHEDTVIDFVEHQLPRSEVERVKLHIADCGVCRRIVAEAAMYVVGDGPPTRTRVIETDADETSLIERVTSAALSSACEVPLVPKTAVGRYVVNEVVGSGGMGIVYRAQDPQLDRSVALKLIRPDRPMDEDTELRLLGEARAMAQLSHPNVVHVYDAGAYERRLFIAMEFVEGGTLNRWLHDKSPPWTEVLDTLIEAGRGLGAAHRANLVHRDFKPSNVLMGSDHRPRVTDFGLALNMEDAASSSSSTRSRPGGRILRTMFAGTPAYMAPEQYLGEPVDARTDQFSFCVTLFEALFGERPFAGTTRDAIRARMLKGEVREPPASSGVPAALRDAILRGLRADRSERYPAMEALIDDLAARRTRAMSPSSAVPRARRRLRPIMLLVLGAIAVLGVVGASELLHRPELAGAVVAPSTESESPPRAEAPPEKPAERPVEPEAIPPRDEPKSAKTAGRDRRIVKKRLRARPSKTIEAKPRTNDPDALKPFDEEGNR